MTNWQRKSHAAPSQAVTWKLLGITPDKRVCSVCGRKLTLDDLAQYHVTVGEPMRLRCNDCPVLV